MSEQQVATVDGEHRRAFLKKAGIAGAAAWAAPTLLSTAAHAQGTGCFPIPLTNNQQRSTVFTDGSTIQVSPPASFAAQVAVAMVPINDATAATTVLTPSGSGWTVLLAKSESAPVGPDGDRIAMIIWGRTSSLSTPVTFTLSGDAADQWRAAVFEYANVFAFGTPAVQSAVNTNIATAPAVNLPAEAGASVLWIAATRTDLGLDGFLPPTGYAAAALQFQDTPELCSGHLNDLTGPDTVPAASATMPGFSDVIAAQVPVLCTYN